MLDDKSAPNKLQVKCVCIVPFYNERKSILGILDSLLKIKSISKIICVDDSSTDGAPAEIEEKYPQITLVKSPTNQGKSNAVKLGLAKSLDSEYVIMIDADIKNLDTAVVEEALDYVLRKSDTDMLIFKRAHEPIDFLSRLLRSATLLSGERIVRTKDLQEVMKKNPKGYQLEVVMNLYMEKNNKKVCFMQSPVVNPFKKDRRGFVGGFTADLSMTLGIFKYAGYKNYIRLIHSFCKKEFVPGKMPAHTI